MTYHIATGSRMAAMSTRKGSKWKDAFKGVSGAIVEATKHDSTPWPILKAKLDKAFSELIRMTHADDNGMVTCIDGCGRSGHWKDFDCGHFVTRDKLPTRWHMDNARPQAGFCNRKCNGKQYEFGQALNRESPGLADRMFALSEGPADQVRLNADQLLLEIRAALKIQRKRFR
jgi:hypothetical protein